jgi:hypothetical protein
MNGMRLPVVALLLLHSLASSAQPFIGDEFPSDALRPANARLDAVSPAVAMAQDLHGVAIAWTMRNASGANAVYVARLDADGRIVAPATEVHGIGIEVEAYWPSIAALPGGTGFTLAWVELLREPRTDLVRGFYCRLDANLQPSEQHVLAIGRTVTIKAPAIVRSGTSTWMSFNGSVRELRADGSLGPELDAGAPVSDMVADSDFPKVVTGQSIETGWICTGDPTCSLGGPFIGYCNEACRIYRYAYELHFVSLYTGSAVRTMAFNSDSRPAVESDGRDVLVAWMNGEQTAGGTVTAVRLSGASFVNVDWELQNDLDLGTFGPDVVATRPDIATDRERYVVVWSTKTSRGDHDIVGASVDRDGQVTPLSIATTEADERDPSVLMTAPGNFRVAYEKLGNGERRVATRSLKFNRRRRAVH